jgi:uracil-DNA glycosylase
MENLQQLDLLKSISKQGSQESQKLNHKERQKLLSKAVDEDGNLYSIGEEDKIYLRKANTREDICLGKILVGEKNLLYYKFEDERNIFRNTQAWSINYTIFQQVDFIIYETLTKSYTIPKQRAVEFGEVVKFQEKKINIPLVYWDIRKNIIDPNEARRRNLFGDSWYELLKSTIESEYMSKIGTWLRKRRTEVMVYPDEQQVFRALKLTHVKQVKVIILGQDPYTDGSANGLAFGFKNSSTKRPSKSLDVILKEVEQDCYNGMHLDFDNTLVAWAEQGVLLLNTVLTVERGKPKSHEMLGWQRFVKILLYEMLVDQAPKVFILWGNEAWNLYKEVEARFAVNAGLVPNILVLKSKHPAADLYGGDQMGNIKPNYPETFAGNKHFSQANAYLLKNKRRPITW